MIRLKGYCHSLEEKGKLVHDIRVANRSTRCRSVPSALRNGSGIQSNISIKVEDTCELKMSADIDDGNECPLLVLLYNFERMRSIRLADQALDIFKGNQEVQDFSEAVLPGVTSRLQQNPSDAFDDLQSTEVLLRIQRSIDADAADEIENKMRKMVAMYCGSDASREMLREFATSSEWQSMRFELIDGIVGISPAALMQSLPRPCSLTLRCTSKTSRGDSMTIGYTISVPDEDDFFRNKLLYNVEHNYQGKSLSDISAAIWSSRAVLADTIEATIVFPGEVNNGESTIVNESDAGPLSISCNGYELQEIHLALAWLFCENRGSTDRAATLGTRLRALFNRKEIWVPSNSRIKWRLQSGEINSGGKQVGREGPAYFVQVVDDTGSQVSENQLHPQSIDGFLEALDALQRICPDFSIPPSRFPRV